MKAATCAVGVLSVALCAPVFAKDVLLYKVSKGIHYQQSLTNPPTILLENGYVFEAHVFLPMAGTVTSAMVESSEGTDRPLELEDNDQFEFRNRVNLRATLDIRYPDGPFTFTINAVHDGQKVLSLPLTGNAYPNFPRIANLPQLQSINANGYAIVQWEPFAGGNAEDFIQLRIEDRTGDRVFETRDLGEPGALDGTATYAIFDPDTLDPNTTYQATLRFEKSRARDLTSYVGVPGWSTYHAVTQFPLATSAAVTPVVESYSVTKGRRFDQTSSAPPEPDLDDEFYFTAEVQASSSDAVISVLLSRPVGEAIMLLTDGSESSYSDWKQTREFLDAEYVDGLYTFNIETASQGNRVLSLRLAGDAYPTVPRLSNFNPAEPVRADRDLILEWDAWTDGTASDFIQLRIEDGNDERVFETSDFGKNGALKGGATWTSVPAGTLRPGEEYRARLVFTRFVTLDTTSFPGALGMASYYSRTKFVIITGPPDMSAFSIVKGREYRQTAADTVVPNGRYIFRANVAAASAGAIQSASLTVSGGWSLPLTLHDDGMGLSRSETFSTQGELDAAYPDGTYRLTMRGANDGLRTVTLALVGGAYPNPPLVSEFAAMGQIIPYFDFLVAWAPFEGGEPKDFVRLDIRDRAGGIVYSTGDYDQPGSLAGLNTAVMVPWDYFLPNSLYLGSVLFEEVFPVEDAAYPDVKGRAGYFSSTECTLATWGDGNPSTIFDLTLLPDGSVQFSFRTIVGGAYRIEGSSDLINWTPLATVSATGEQTLYYAPRPTGVPHYFYRAALLR